MMRTVKIAVCAAALAAITTINAHADLIVVGTITDEPEFFSATLQFTPGQGGENFTLPDGANWRWTMSIAPHLGAFRVFQFARHEAAPHGSPEEVPSPNFIIFDLGTPGSGFPLSASATVDHGAIPGHQDVFSATLEQVGDTSPVWRITLSGRHEEVIPSVPDAASSVILLGLGLAGLGTVRRYLNI